MIGLRQEVYNTSKLNSILSWCQRKTRLEKQLLIGVLAVTITIFGFFVDTAGYFQKATLACETRQCITASSSIIHQLDETIDPCEDFFKFACGTMSEKTHFKNIPIKFFLGQLRKQMMNFLTEPINPTDHPYLNFEKKLFIECINESKDGTSLNVLKSLLLDLGGWPLLQANKWNETNFSWISLIGKLKDNGLFHEPFLNVDLKQDSFENTITNVLTVNQQYFHPDRYKTSYKNLMIQSAIAFGIEEDTATEEMTKVFYFSVQLDQLRNYHDDNNTTRLLLLSELQTNHNEIDWEKFLNLNLEPIHTVSRTDYVEFQYPSFPKQFCSLLSSNDLRTVVNYVIWVAIAEILPLISNQLLEISNQFYCITTLPTTSLVEECENSIFNTVNLAPLKIAYAKRYTPKSARRKVKEMLDFIVNEFKEMISQASWVDAETIIKTYSWLDDFKYIIGIESNAEDNLYAEIPKSIKLNDPFLIRFLQTKKERNCQDLLEIRYKNETSTFYAHFQTLRGLLITPSLDTVMFPPGTMQGLYFDENQPMYLNFGTLGTLISSTLISFYTSLVINKNIWSKEVREIFKQKTNCVSHNLEYFRSNGVISKAKRRYYSRTKLAKSLGIKLAYNAYNSWARKNGKQLHLIGLNYTDVQLFWISSFSEACFEEAYGTGPNYQSDSESVRHNSNFAIDFNCDLDSKMNPNNKCHVFYKVFLLFFKCLSLLSVYVFILSSFISIV